MFGLAVDDAHHFKRPGDPAAPPPGRGWIYVRAARLEPRAIVEAIDRGEFYASTGVELTDYSADAARMDVESATDHVEQVSCPVHRPRGPYACGGRRRDASYTFKGDEGYVRARVLESNGLMAWTQPVPVGGSGPRLSER